MLPRPTRLLWSGGMSWWMCRRRHFRGDHMDITFYAHACFRLQGDGRVIVTDPYTPGPHGSGFDPLDEPADIVIMSSATDRFHSDPSHILGNPTVVNALELPPEGATVRGLYIQSFAAMENLQF